MGGMRKDPFRNLYCALRELPKRTNSCTWYITQDQRRNSSI